MDTGNIPDFNGSGQPPHKFCGYFLQYPDSEYEGLVSTITDVAPILNWIYVDRATYEVKYGVRDFAQPNLTGPFDCTREDRRLTLEGWEGFVAVEVVPDVWALYYDRDDNGLRDKLPPGARVLEVELTRREKKIEKPADDDQDLPSLDEMLERQKQKHADEDADRARQQQQASEGLPLDEGGDGKREPLAQDGKTPEEPHAVTEGQPGQHQQISPERQEEPEEATAEAATPAQMAGEQPAERPSRENTSPAHEKDATEVPTEAEQTISAQQAPPPPPPATEAEVAATVDRLSGLSSDDGPAKEPHEDPRPVGQQKE